MGIFEVKMYGFRLLMSEDDKTELNKKWKEIKYLCVIHFKFRSIALCVTDFKTKNKTYSSF